MSKIVLCETKPAKTAYTIHKINRSFQSYEELCWLLEHYLIFFLSEGIDRSLKNYLKEYLNLEIKSEDAVQQVKEIINFQNYFTADEKIQFQQKIRTTYLYSAAKKQKLLADMYLKHHLYLMALTSYQKLEMVSGKLNPNEQMHVWYHMGLCQSRMFCFDEAKESFRKALMLKPEKQIQEAYFMISYLSVDEKALSKMEKQFLLTRNTAKPYMKTSKNVKKRFLRKNSLINWRK